MGGESLKQLLPPCAAAALAVTFILSVCRWIKKRGEGVGENVRDGCLRVYGAKIFLLLETRRAGFSPAVRFHTCYALIFRGRVWPEAAGGRMLFVFSS